MKTILLASAAIFALGTASAFAAEKEFAAKLVSQAILPANTIIPAPADAPEHLKTSAKFTTADRMRAEGLGTVPGKDGIRSTGLSMPFNGQAMQGFSGIKTMDDGTFWSLSDNGFGSKLNSSDAMLMLHHLKFDWDNGKVAALETVFLSDPDKKAPFPLVMEGSEKRYLTGADFDVESIQPTNDGFWVGEEFGPYILKFARDGKLTDVVSTKAGNIDVKSPDHPALALPGNPTQKMPAFNLKRSGGYEGMAMSKDGSKLYGLLEGPLYTADGQVEKTEDGATGLRIIELDVASKNWTGRTWLYPLAEGGEAIGDFNMLDDSTALVIERDNGAGTTDKACADPKKPETNCFAVPAKLKRIYKIEFNDANVGKAARKIGYIDLMKIADPDNKAKQGSANGIYTMPLVTIENVDKVDATHIIVGNDNNLPFSAGRTLDKADDNEFVLLEVKDLLDAK
ncbi:esterase-like activity of phytase family protein [Agrobacterium vaccinii]|uniref:esterase-like activity of phytase family protein n=1 Tax=Agrobacterium vaccinii TaxID=2735528 RepID=UPI001E2EB144|nr:esterase-like activity of phytase family protein [Agrobacterium vaccinii]UHS56204.1 esterase-like activity of phytase family protein [Agrobacterium vaccinii]